jgi:uncharacterized damage-inducible protein DinB
METAAKQTRLADAILAEIDQEAEITKRLFDIIPEDKLQWRPHPKAKSLGELAMHLATLQGSVAQFVEPDSAEVNPLPDKEASSRPEILQAFAESLQKAKEIVGSTDDARAVSEWKLTKNGQILMTASRINFWRSILLNHNYHHRGQLSVYLRQLDVPLPSIYGPSADTNPFEQKGTRTDEP